ncbi:D-alanyl-D-alanine carboxypeptidase/D-alanyl-D-alanine-endopeptidase [Shewanella sp. KX20019]|uniref:D-alanyl-D-alanine carboxypeptidase/D-alanyl-D-alanine endopeptidase n=1 Tax=Shewanella sp. KX20019 TaxID=2803864 RepID=UPI001926A038|nr:D-alanyl-D-alanine carboxypeptidase/D-alanyl-D-alanine-endopeptidase [Shewanella sp. KX20019]QQX78298.1 D-alanyl-D-alanine carboxypeptidase/D-alanyl-D-alanine-endopeptidase [Shewanella sp. KX20019]
MTLRHIVSTALFITLPYTGVTAEQSLTIPSSTALTTLKVVSTNTDVVTHSQNADKLFIPASTMKLLTAVSATAVLGKNFRYQTNVYADNSIHQGQIRGNIYITFSGDPTLTTRNIQTLLHQLKDQGLDHITGNVYLVGEQHENYHAPGRVWDDLGICYAAPVSSYVLNKNCIEARFQPKLADDAGVVELLGNEPVIIESQAIFDKIGKRAICDLTLARTEKNSYLLKGCYPGNKALKLAVAITEPGLYAKDKLTQLIKYNDISINGSISLVQQHPGNALLIAQHQSEPLTTLIATMLLKSDNLIADSLLKRMGQHLFGSSGTFANGSAAMAQILSQQGVDLSSANIVDGSGLSRYNLLSANQLVQVLQLIEREPHYRYIIDVLPIAGKTGTLKYRHGYTHEPLKDQVVAKTGSMLGVANIAGFIKQEDGLQSIVVILQNGVSPKADDINIQPYDVAILKQLLNNVEQE